MRKSKFKPYTINNLEIINAGSEGKCIARADEKVIMIDHAVPGDILDVKVYASKRKFGFGAIEKIIRPSPDRVETFCEHFGTCGGCKWQQMSYDAQLSYKEQQVRDAFERIGKFNFPPLRKILGSDDTEFYRNKLEYTFTDKQWLANLDTKDSLSPEEHLGLGYHIPGRFDKVFNVHKCWLMDDLHNEIRNAVKEFAMRNQYSFFNLYGQHGLLRNMIIRNTSSGDWMVIMVFGMEDEEKITALLGFIHTKFPAITSLQYVINTKKNDTIFDLDIKMFKGEDHLIEWLEDLKFKIGPKSFFQTNTNQTLKLYSKAREFAGLTGKENVYDLYTGVGTIALFVARNARQVTGIESIEGAIANAKVNAGLNHIANVNFYAGDMKDVLNDELISKHGKPDVIITDPPRAGMHEDVISKMIETKAERIVYVSCNPATQARDIALMDPYYEVTTSQPVDMFPHTHHVENVTLLTLRSD